jgi:hypothetical protein
MTAIGIVRKNPRVDGGVCAHPHAVQVGESGFSFYSDWADRPDPDDAGSTDIVDELPKSGRDFDASDKDAVAEIVLNASIPSLAKI